MLCLKILRSPYPHARIVSIDTSKALALLGVKAVLTHKDVRAFSPNPLSYWPDPRMPILTDVARFQGDDIAVVAAVDEDTAVAALDLIKVDYQVLPFVLDPEEALKAGAPQLFPTGNLIGGKPAVVNRGDVEKGFAEADVVLEARYRTPILQHASGESRVSIAQWEGGRLTIWDSTQGPFEVQEAVAKALHVPMSKVHVICEFMGGGFGDKGHPGRHQILAALMARKTGRPVRIELDRDELYLGGSHRYAAICDLKYGVKKDGTLTAIKAKVVADTGAYALVGPAAPGTLEVIMSVYRCPNMRGEGYSVSTNKPTTGAMRCVGHPQGTFAQEVHMDAIAQKLGMDPVELRLKNYARLEDGDQFRKIPFTSNGMEECIKRGAETFQWKEKMQTASQPGPVKKGFGVAVHACRHGGMAPGVPLSGMVRVDADGTVNVFTGATELGGGQKTTMSMIAAEELGVLLSDVFVISADTDMTTDTGVTTGSRQTITGGTGVKLAAADAKNQLLDVAAAELKADKKDLSIRDSVVYVAGSEKGISLDRIVSKAPGMVVVGRGVMKVPTDVFFHGFAAQFAEVEVDTRNGQVKVVKIVAAHDLGRAINPLTAESQIEIGRAHV
jgi:CO/xanthine dehydrogenase Mo-binding subunit